jgi:hypothetical protein
MRGQDSLKDGRMAYRQSPIEVILRIESGGGAFRSNSLAMGQPLEPESGLRSGTRYVALSVAVLIIYGVLAAVFHWLWPRITGLLPIASALLAGATIGVLASKGYGLLRKPSPPEADPIDASDVEVDLRSTNPIDARVLGDIPQLELALRVTNFSLYDITVADVSATVAFSQVSVELSLKRSVEIAAGTTGRDVILRQVLEGPVVTAINAFFAREDDLSRCVYVSVDLTFNCDAGSFRKPVPMFQRYLPEILSIKRW